MNIKYFMTAYLGLLLIFSAMMTGQPIFILKGFSIVAAYSFFDLILTRIKDKVWFWPVSSWISGLILALVFWPDLPWYFIILLPLLAALSKHFLHFGKIRHVFNPAAFALVITSFFVPSVAWWGSAWGNIPLILISLVGLFILWRQSRWDEFFAFAISYIILFSIFFGFTTLQTSLLQGSLIFFASIMLIEPITSQFPSRNQRIIYGILVAFFAILTTFLLGKFPTFSTDPLLFGLLLANITASLFFLPHYDKNN